MVRACYYNDSIFKHKYLSTYTSYCHDNISILRELQLFKRPQIFSKD